MLLTPHLLAGAAIASKISNPAWALPLALLSHYFLDLPPQAEYSVKNITEGRWENSFRDFLKVFLDISFGFLLIFSFSENTPLIFTAASLSILPDATTLLAIIFPQNKLLNKHWQFHWKINNFCKSKKIPQYWGIFSQIIIIVIAILLLT